MSSPVATLPETSAARQQGDGGRRTGLRVCVLAEAFAPIVGGGETHSLMLSEELSRLGLPVIVVTRRTTKQLATREQRGPLTIRRVVPWGFKRVGKYLMLPAALGALIRDRHQYDLIYVAGFRVVGIIAVLAGRLLGRPAVLRAESNGEFSGEFLFQGAVARHALLRHAAALLLRSRNALLRRADMFLAITRGIEGEFIAGGVPTNRIVYIPNGVEADRFVPPDPAAKASLRAHLGLPPDRVIWCYTGKLMRGKGLELLLEVWRRVVADDSRLLLVLVGGGSVHALSCETELREYVARHGLGASVRFTGYVGNVVDYLQAADFFVLPSEREAMSVSVIEAMACGLPVIATRVGGTAEVVENRINGCLVDPRDGAALERTMRELVSDPGLARRLGERARARVLDRFDIRVVAREHAAVFRTLAARSSSVGDG